MPLPDHARVAVVGASGFVGSAIVRHLDACGVEVVPVAAPRIRADFGGDAASQSHAWLSSSPGPAGDLVAALTRAHAVVNAAGVAAATAAASPEMWGANAVLPRVIFDAVAGTSVAHFVHVSSAAVQGSRPVLDESPAPQRAHSPYATSKAAGERAVLASRGTPTTVYRPTSVLGVGRPLTSTLARVLRARWLVVPDPSVPLPITTDGHVAEAVKFLLDSRDAPRIALHPSEGVTTGSLATALGRDRPIPRLPRPLGAVARAGVRTLARGGPVAGHARRLELLWEGQRQASGMSELGFVVADDGALASIGRSLASGTARG